MSAKPPKERPSWLRIAQWIVGTAIVGSVSFIASVYQLWGGPPWPTSPVVDSGGPDASSAFAVPFIVKNKSAFFNMNGANVTCSLVKVATEAGSTYSDFGLKTIGGNSIGALEERPYKCVFPFTGAGVGKIVFAKINLRIQYSYWFFGQHPVDASDGPFTWDTTMSPPRWIKGEFLR
jgi:hypothetical protein